MKKLMTIAFVLMTSMGYASAELFESANAAYKEGNYTLAIEQYETVLADVANEQVFYNLGNAYYKTGEFTKAILYYEKALKLASNDKDIKHNLELARLNIVDKIVARPEFFLLTWWKVLASKLSANTWTILFLASLWASILALLIFAFSHVSFRKFLFLNGLTGLLLSVVLVLLAVTQNHYESNSNSAIIMSPSASVKSAPLNSGTDLFIIHEGLKVSIIDDEGDWYKICLPDDKQGWLPKNMIAVI